MNDADAHKAKHDCELRKTLQKVTHESAPQQLQDGKKTLGDKRATTNGIPCCALLMLDYLIYQCSDPTSMLHECRVVFDRYLSRYD